MKKEIVPTQGLFTRPFYSHVVKAGNTIYIAGEVSRDENGNIVGKGNFQAQAEKILDNLRLALKAAGATLDDVVSTTVFITPSAGNLGEIIPLFREIVTKHFGTVHPPASTWVVVNSLVSPDYLIEINAVAVVE